MEKGKTIGGIVIWANNILDYYKSVETEIELVPISYDRSDAITKKSSPLQRILYGVNDYMKSIRETKKYIKENHVDILHLCSSAQLSLYKDLFVLKMAKKMRVKTVIHFHFGRIPELLEKNNQEAKMIKRVCGVADTVVVMDYKSQEALLNAGFKNVINLPNPLSTGVMNEVKDNEGKIARIENRILYVGHLYQTKGVSELVKACADIDGIELHLIGSVEEPYLRELECIAKSNGNGLWLKYRGKMSHSEVIKEMFEAGVFCLPSYTEGFPNVILESMACGCSIVATPVGAIPEMLQFNGKELCGLSVEVKNVDDIKTKILTFINDKAIRDFCRRNAVHRVNDNYAIPIIWRQLECIWNNVKQ